VNLAIHDSNLLLILGPLLQLSVSGSVRLGDNVDGKSDSPIVLFTTHPSSLVISHVLISGNPSVLSSGNGNFINNWTLLIFFVLFQDY